MTHQRATEKTIRCRLLRQIFNDTQRPDIIKAITDVPHATGPTAREKLFTPFNLFQNHGRIHRIICLDMLNIRLGTDWAHHEKSNFRNQAESIIYDYVLASSDTEVTTLLVRSLF